ncbi:MAG: RNA methyltransferase [Oscillospiraceae bacterium]|nr:RNA methyltransferase [Oscillospiraceae bacterium]
MEIITSRENPVLKLYRKLSDSKKERLKYKMFVLEGLRIVTDALNENSGLKHLILTQQAFEKYQSEFSQADLNNTRLIVISNELGNRIAQTEKTQGVFAVCSMPEKIPLKLDRNGKYLILLNVQDPGNMGMIIRTADALGIDGIIASECCDLYNPKVIRSTMGSIFRMKIFTEPDTDIIFSELSGKNIKSFASVTDSDALNINSVNFNGGCAVFIGNEGNGLPEEVSEKCTEKITIPMHGTINSLNAAMAAGIIMWELKRNE